MGLLRKLSFLALFVAILVGVVIVKFPVPEDMEGKCQARAVGAVFSVMDFTVNILEKLKVGTRVELLHQSTEYILRSLSLFSKPGIKERWETIAETPVMIFEPESREKNSPVIIYIHGGGWAWFSPKSYRYVTQNIAKETNYLVMSIDYPLAPKHVHPAQKNACLAVVKYVRDNAEKWGVDKNKIIIAGDSAGGHLTAAITLELKDQAPESKTPRIAAQILIYPALQFVDFSLPSHQNDTKVVLSIENTVWFSQLHALGTVNPQRIQDTIHNKHISSKHANIIKSKIDHKKLPKRNFHKEYKSVDFITANSQYKDYETIAMDPSFSPLLADNYKNTPPTLLFTMQYDVLRDEGYLYADRLMKDGVKVSHTNYNSFHGAMSYKTQLPFFQDIARFTKSIVGK